MHRTELEKFTDLPNVGPATAKDFVLLGIHAPAELIGRDPYQMYLDLCEITGSRQDPCVIDVFISAVRFMQGGPAKKWWEFSAERKQALAGRPDFLPDKLMKYDD